MPTETKKLDKKCASFLREKNGTWDFVQPVGKNVKLHEMKNEKNYECFLMHKI